MTLPTLKVTKTGAIISQGKKTIAVEAQGGVTALNLTNDYGNSVSYSITENQFDSLFAALWQFVKDSQH